jgi:hypothetical protein
LERRPGGDGDGDSEDTALSLSSSGHPSAGSWIREAEGSAGSTVSSRPVLAARDGLSHDSRGPNAVWSRVVWCGRLLR